ncbi:MAG: hypothetical protein Kilf2KO_49130 [Rhodospirillales bacterium]
MKKIVAAMAVILALWGPPASAHESLNEWYRMYTTGTEQERALALAYSDGAFAAMYFSLTHRFCIVEGITARDAPEMLVRDIELNDRLAPGKADVGVAFAMMLLMNDRAVCRK